MFISELSLYWENVDFYNITTIVLYCLLAASMIACAVMFVLYAVKKKSVFFSIGKALALVGIGVLLVLSLILVDHWGDAVRVKVDGKKIYPWYWHFTKYAVIVVGVAVMGAVIGLLGKKQPAIASTKELTFAAISVAASFALSYISLFKMPMGGSVTLASVLPLAIYCFYYGFKKGLLAAFAYSLLQMFQEPVIYAFGQVLLDYILPYTAVACVGIFSYKNKILGKWGIFVGMLIYSVIRYFCHFLSGALYFGIWMPEGWDNVWIYSLAYNSTVFIDTLIAAAVGFVLMATNYFPRYMERFVARGESLARRTRQPAPMCASVGETSESVAITDSEAFDNTAIFEQVVAVVPDEQKE